MGVLKTRGPICTKFGGDIVRSSLHTRFKNGHDMLLERWSAIRSKIALFDPCKIRGGVGEMPGSMIVATPITEPLVYI